MFLCSRDTTGKIIFAVVYLFKFVKIYRFEDAEWMKNECMWLAAWFLLNQCLSLTKSFSFLLCSIIGLMVLFLWPLCFLKSEHNRLMKINIYFGFAFVSYRTQSCCLKRFRAATLTVVPPVFYLKVLLTLLLISYTLYFWSLAFVITGFFFVFLSDFLLYPRWKRNIPHVLFAFVLLCACDTQCTGQSFREAH